MPGLSSPPEVSDHTATRPMTQAWITEELIAETRRVWSPIYGRTISDEEAVEMLTNVKQFVEILLRAKRREQQS